MRHKKVQYLVVCIVILLGNSRKVSSLTEDEKSIDACLDAFKGWKVCKIKSILTLRCEINCFIIKRINFAKHMQLQEFKAQLSTTFVEIMI